VRVDGVWRDSSGDVTRMLTHLSEARAEIGVHDTTHSNSDVTHSNIDMTHSDSDMPHSNSDMTHLNSDVCHVTHS